MENVHGTDIILKSYLNTIFFSFNADQPQTSTIFYKQNNPDLKKLAGALKSASSLFSLPTNKSIFHFTKQSITHRNISLMIQLLLHMLVTHFQQPISLNKSIVWIGSCLTCAVPVSVRVVLPENVNGFHLLLIPASFPSFPLEMRNIFHLIAELISLSM